MKDLANVIASPLISEKGTLVNEAGNQYVFKVHRDANKIEIGRAVEVFFKVTVKKVRTINYLGKYRRVGRWMGQRPNWKKAYVTIAEGQRIDFFENV